jgi:hypothetical protein
VEFFIFLFFSQTENKHYGIATMGKGWSIDDFKMKSLEIESTTIRICKIDFSIIDNNNTRIFLGFSVYITSLFINMPIG